MKEVFNTSFTVFKDLFKSKDTPYTVTLAQAYERIKIGNKDLIEKISIIRNEKDKDKRNDAKKKLLAIMFNGVFTERNNKSLKEHSGMCIIDFDDYPSEEEKQKHWDKLVADKYTLMCFTSPSGNGIKLLIRIPKCDMHDHVRRFKAYKKYIDSPYFDDANCNVSRVCYESYDPNIYLNQKCDEFKEIEKESGFSKLEKVPVCPVLDEIKIIEKIMSFNWSTSFMDGERNVHIFKLASKFCEYGIPQESAEQYIIQNVVNDYDFDKEALVAIKSAYKTRDFGVYYFEDKDLVLNIKTKLKTGVKAEEIAKTINVSVETVKEIQEDVYEQADVFWDAIKSKSGKERIEIDPYKYSLFLVKNGFLKYYPENAEQPTFVRVIENKVNITSPEQIKDFVLQYLLDKKLLNVWNYAAKSTELFNSKFLNMIESVYLKMLQDDKETSYIPFKNGVVKVTKNEIELLNYIDVEGYIWENQILERDFVKIDNFTNDFQNFISKITNSDKQRTMSLESTLGYLIHAYKDKTDQKAIIFNDQEIDDNPNGGSGKSLMLNALKYMRKIMIIDGKIFDPKKSDFVYQRVTLDTQLLAFDDVKKNFNFEQLFSIITEGITVNRKNKDEIFIPFERSPKIIITTNYVIAGTGNSHERRRHEVEIYQYFNDRHTPSKEYGRLLFDSWKENDWNLFYNYMISCLQLYLQRGLLKVESINSDKKKLIQSTCKEFYDWAIEDSNINLNVRTYNQDSFNKFQNENPTFKELNPRIFLGWVKQYCTYEGYLFTKGKDYMGRWFEISKISKEGINNTTNETPF
jgi:hypothetical protein